MEGMMGCILVLNRRLITNIAKNVLIKYQNRSSNNILKLFCVLFMFYGKTEMQKNNSPYQVLFVYRQRLE